MAFRKSLAQRLLKFTKFSSQTLTNGRISGSSVQSRILQNLGEPDIAPEPGDMGIFRRFLHKRTLFQPELRSPPLRDGGLVDQLKAIGIAGNRIRLDGLIPPPTTEKSDLTAEDARKLLKAAQMEMVKSRLKEIPESSIPYSEFVRICEEYCSDQDQAKKTAEMLDDSAAVIVLGDVVFLRPEQVPIFFLFSPFLFNRTLGFFLFLYCPIFLVFLGCVCDCEFLRRVMNHDRPKRYVSHTFSLF